jgi:hypothetical protein
MRIPLVTAVIVAAALIGFLGLTRPGHLPYESSLTAACSSSDGCE